ncbi:MAG: hypothetical protein ACRC1W_06330 [Shewanella sp.]
MSKYKRDDGSFSVGMFMMAVVLAAFTAGYALRDSGFQFSIKNPQHQVERP